MIRPLGFLALGSVVLSVTGAEALYADMGHFGRKPIPWSWLWFVMPALLLNYFGQIGDAARRAGNRRQSLLPDGAGMGAAAAGGLGDAVRRSSPARR